MNKISKIGKVITLVVTCLGSLMVLLDATIVVTALPTIQSSLHTNLSDLQWAVDTYTLSFAALMLTAPSGCKKPSASLDWQPEDKPGPRSEAIKASMGAAIPFCAWSVAISCLIPPSHGSWASIISTHRHAGGIPLELRRMGGHPAGGGVTIF